MLFNILIYFFLVQFESNGSFHIYILDIFFISDSSGMSRILILSIDLLIFNNHQLRKYTRLMQRRILDIWSYHLLTVTIATVNIWRIRICLLVTCINIL